MGAGLAEAGEVLALLLRAPTRPWSVDHLLSLVAAVRFHLETPWLRDRGYYTRTMERAFGYFKSS